MKKTFMIAMALLAAVSASGQRVMERLDRGLVGQSTADGAYLSWRWLSSDPDDVTFDIYRVPQGEVTKPSKFTKKKYRLNPSPISLTTDFVDSAVDKGTANTWIVKSSAGDVATFSLEAGASVKNYFSVPLQVPAPRKIDGLYELDDRPQREYTFSANDCSVGDLDGDGEYEIVVKWWPSANTLPPRTGMTGVTIYDAYKLDGTLMWRIDCGVNIRSGAAYNQFLVYDFDGDGRSEIAFKTADGTIDGLGHPIGDPDKDWRTHDLNSGTYGKIVEGPEYLTVFDGTTGEALATTEYIPSRFPLDGWGGIGGNGGNDTTGGRADRMTACVAYLDGHLPSIVMIRGWYGRTAVTAYDWRDGQLTCRWAFDSEGPDNPYSGMGNHSATVADFDGDGFDEVCVGAMTVDHDGKGLYTTGLRHGDALHAGDLIPSRPGLEVFGVHENEESTVRFQTPGSALYDGATGEIVWSNNPAVDVGRGMAADIDPDYPGVECWGAPGGTRRSDTGEPIYSQTPSSVNFGIWWDADPLRELLDRTEVSKWDWKNRKTDVIMRAEGVVSNNGSKSNPCLSGDLFGDWREEVIFATPDSRELRIFMTDIPAQNRMTTLMHDAQYRLAICWQNVAYNQPPHPSFFIGADMEPAPRPVVAFPESR